MYASQGKQVHLCNLPVVGEIAVQLRLHVRNLINRQIIEEYCCAQLWEDLCEHGRCVAVSFLQNGELRNRRPVLEIEEKTNGQMECKKYA